MKDLLKHTSKRFVSAEKTLHKAFPLQMPYVYPLCALLFLEEGKQPDSHALKNCDELFAKRSSLSFDFSGTSTLMVISQMSMADEPDALLDRIQRAKKELKKQFPIAREAIPLAAVLLSNQKEEDWASISKQAKDIFGNITKHNRILTTGGDIIFALLLAISEKEPVHILDQAESCYQYLKKELPGTEPVTLSRVLALSLGDTPEEKCQKFLAVYHGMAEAGHPYGRQYQLPMLGLASMLPKDAKSIVEDITAVDKYLGRQDLYRGLLTWYSHNVRLMHAAMIVASTATLNQEDESEDRVSSYAKNALLAMRISIWSLFYLLFV